MVQALMQGMPPPHCIQHGKTYLHPQSSDLHVVTLPKTSQLFSRKGIHWVLFILVSQLNSFPWTELYWAGPLGATMSMSPQRRNGAVAHIYRMGRTWWGHFLKQGCAGPHSEDRWIQYTSIKVGFFLGELGGWGHAST